MRAMVGVRVMVTELVGPVLVSRQHEQMKSRTLAIANISKQQMMSTKIMNLSQVVNQGLCETALSAEHESPVF